MPANPWIIEIIKYHH